MKGNQNIINHLNELLSLELTAIDVYFVHSRMYKDWGLTKLYQQFDHEKDDENIHATKLIERILLLEGTPILSKRVPIEIATDVKSMFSQGLDFELVVAKKLESGIQICEKEGDFVTREILLTLLKETEEDHINWLETNLELMEKIGIQNYQQSQM
ncbi:MAG: bacterioferritin [Bacteriovoracaceae bacterium]|nr:bacterioferritin [Bacteriovoracaceae bacterium]